MSNTGHAKRDRDYQFCKMIHIDPKTAKAANQKSGVAIVVSTRPHHAKRAGNQYTNKDRSPSADNEPRELKTISRLQEVARLRGIGSG